MRSIFDEYLMCLVHDILNNQLNEDSHAQLIPVKDDEFVYRNLTIPNVDTLKQKMKLTINNKTIKLNYTKIYDGEFKEFLYENIQSQANDGISANIGKSAGMENLTAKIGSRLRDIVVKLNSYNIPSSFTQVYYENDVKAFHKKIKNTFALARFKVGFLKQNGIKVLRTANDPTDPHVLIVSEKLEEQVSNYVKNKINGKYSPIDILDANEQNDVYNFLKNIIYDDIKTSTYVPLSYNPIAGKIIRKQSKKDKTKDIMKDMEKHCVFSSIFHRTYFDKFIQTKHLAYSVCYDGDGFILFEYDSEMDNYIYQALREPDRYNVTIIESFRSFLERKGILESLYK